MSDLTEENHTEELRYETLIAEFDGRIVSIDDSTCMAILDLQEATALRDWLNKVLK